MNSSDDLPEDPANSEEPELTQEELDAWLLEDPNRAEALMKVMAEVFEAKRAEMSPEEVKEIESYTKQFESEAVEFLIPQRYNELADRMQVLLDKETFTQDEVDEMKAGEAKLKQLIDMALSLKEPRRTEAITVMQECLEEVQFLLGNLSGD